MPRTREAYVFKGGARGIDTAKATAWGIGRLWYQADDPVASAAALADCRARGVGVGLKMDGSGPALAEAMSAALTAHGFGPTTGPYSCGAMFDDELHDWTKTVAMLKRWRELRKTRYTVLTFEPFQGGAFTPELVAYLNADTNLLVVPQGYVDLAGDPLYPAFAPAVLENLAGILPSKLELFLPVKAREPIPYGWEGILYGFAGLPATPPAPL